jgi:hypothetical protein
MPKFTMKALSEVDKKKDVFIPLEENLYVVEVESAEWGKTKVKIWQGRQAIETDEEEDQLIVTFLVRSAVDGSAIKRIDGEEMVNPKMKMFIVEKDLGYNKKEQCHRDGRLMVCALTGLDPDDELEFDEQTFIGKQAKCFIELYTKQNGDKGNKMTKFKPIK